MDLSWEDRALNTEVPRRANITGTEALIVKAQLQWVGRVVRMDDARLTNMVFSDLTTCARNIGRPLKRLKDGLKASIKLFISPRFGWETLVTDRIAWRIAIHKGVQCFEENRLHDLDQKRRARKERRPDPAPAFSPTASLMSSSLTMDFRDVRGTVRGHEGAEHLASCYSVYILTTYNVDKMIANDGNSFPRHRLTSKSSARWLFRRGFQLHLLRGHFCSKKYFKCDAPSLEASNGNLKSNFIYRRVPATWSENVPETCAVSLNSTICRRKRQVTTAIFC